jgi:FAD/FMN-containing dehydrogenase
MVFFPLTPQALKGVGAGFGIVTEFVLKTHEEPSSVQYAFSHSLGKIKDMAPFFSDWQALISDPDLDRRFGSEFVLHELGATVTGTFFGTKKEFEATGIPSKFPTSSPDTGVGVKAMDWLAAVEQQAQDSALWLSDLSASFVARSLAFRQEDLLSEDAITDVFDYIDSASRGTPLWFLIFDVTGGAINDVPLASMSYLHRDKVMFSQGYGVGIPVLNDDTRDFVTGIMSTIRSGVPAGDNLTTYAGYVDPTLAHAQEQYWGSNLPRLMEVKAKWDPKDVFRNPQSVRPAE